MTEAEQIADQIERLKRDLARLEAQGDETAARNVAEAIEVAEKRLSALRSDIAFAELHAAVANFVQTVNAFS